jgi:hypothetical protein
LKITTFDSINDPYELRPFSFRTVEEMMAVESVRRWHADTHGLLCFSKHWKNPVIWSHYAAGHSGLCLGFDIPDAACQEVNYVSELVPFVPTVDPKNPFAPASRKLIDQMHYTKYKDWAYEEEVRMWSTIDEREGDLYFHNFGESLRLTEVILGVGCPHTVALIERAIGPYTGPVEIKRARRSLKRFEMEVETERHRQLDRQEGDVKSFIASMDYISLKKKEPKPNDRCWCGSGKKFKKCHRPYRPTSST